jgi:acyl carrier protein
MSKTATGDKVREILVTTLGLDESEVTDEAKLVDDLGTDCLDIVELVMAIEEGFGIEVHDGDVEKLVTVKDVIQYVEHRKKS